MVKGHARFRGYWRTGSCVIWNSLSNPPNPIASILPSERSNNLTHGYSSGTISCTYPLTLHGNHHQPSCSPTFTTIINVRVFLQLKISSVSWGPDSDLLLIESSAREYLQFGYRHEDSPTVHVRAVGAGNVDRESSPSHPYTN